MLHFLTKWSYDFVERRKQLKKKFVVIALLMIILAPHYVNAEKINSSTLTNYITNENGVVIDKNDYDVITNIYSENYANVMTNEDYLRFKECNIDISKIKQTTKYFKTTIDNLTHNVTTTEVGENEYNGNNPDVEPLAYTYIETEYKRLSISFSSNGDGYGDVFVGLLWKKIPSTRSFDVMAVRFVGAEAIDGTQTGVQLYKINGVNGRVDYGWNGTNINRQDNGFGISMNLLNDTNVNYFEMHIDSCLEFSGTYQAAVASYQHAVTNMTLAQSKSYTLSNAGLGNVIYYSPWSLANNYDGMGGVTAEL